tara:strand:- start:1181 stop:1543 length:363 start_codon:yes stop_codon:yes gene_type:complete
MEICYKIRIFSKNIFPIRLLGKSLLIFFLAYPTYTSLSETSLKENLFSLVNGCLSMDQLAACKKAISILEESQLDEALAENYSCQSRLLALQSELILIMQKLNKNQSSKNIVKEVKQYCL